MKKLEEAMKSVASVVTKKELTDVPDELEAICAFIAENYPEPDVLPVKAPVSLTAAPTADDINGLIAKLKETRVFN